MHLAAEDGAPIGGAAGQRRLLALLAVVAASGAAGISRERLLALLWPESDEEKARRALAQGIYHARRTLGVEELFTGVADLRLNRAALDADVLRFEDAAAAGDLERAAELYAGPFLDGFHLTGSSEFEQWAAAQRSVYERRAVVILDTLARRAEEAGDHPRAVEWRRRAVAIDPLDSLATTRFMSALAAAGDRAGAIRHARVHEALVREQLDVAPDAAVSALAERLREAPEPAATLPEPVATVPETPAAAQAPISTPPDIAPRARTRPARRWIAIAGSSALLVVALVVAAIGRLYHTATGAATITAAQPLVVAPFRVAAADPSLGYLREGMVELLSARLAGDSALHSVDPGLVIGTWRRDVRGGSGADTRADAVRIAGTLGAQQVVIGSVVGSASRVVVSATLVAVPDGATAASVTVEGSADSLTSLVDRVAIGLLATEAGELERLGERTTLSLPALRAYLDGQAAWRRGDFSRAAMRYEQALAADSTFALAALQLALAADRLNDAQQHSRALALAWSARGDLTERDRQYLLAFAGPRYPAPSSEAEQLAAWERAVALSPDRAEAWYELGERYFHDGAVIGVPNAPARAAAALRRALVLDPAHAPARRLLLVLAARQGDLATIAQLATPRVLADSLGDLAPFVRWRIALARDDRPALAAVRDDLARAGAPSLRMIAMASQFDGIAPGDAERALRILRQSRALRASELLDVLLAEHSLALNQGDPVLALDITEQIEELQPGSRAHLRLRVLDALYGGGDRDAAESAAEELDSRAGEQAQSQPGIAAHLADACVIGQWRLATGSTRGVARIVRELRTTESPRIQIPVSPSPLTCAELLDASAAVVARKADAARRVQALDSLMLSGPAVGDARNYAYIAVARLYERLGDRPRALAAIRRRPYMTGWPRYLATARREEARLATGAGR